MICHYVDLSGIRETPDVKVMGDPAGARAPVPRLEEKSTGKFHSALVLKIQKKWTTENMPLSFI
ncbi:hypothetical protein V7654_21350 [Bacillus sp. JJ1609]